MRAHLKERAHDELIAIANHLGFTNLSHTLNVLIAEKYMRIINMKTQNKEVIQDNAVSNTGQ